MEVKTETGRFVWESGTASGWSKDIGTYALAAAMNALAAKEAVCIGVEAQILFPPRADHSKAYALEKSFRKDCVERGIDQIVTRIWHNPLAVVPAITVWAGGQAAETIDCQNCRAGNEIVLVKWIGMEGMLRIAGEKEDELRQRFAPVFIRQIKFWQKEIFAGKELEIARHIGVSSVRQITEGGILAALWDLAKETGCGLDLDMKQMSILQETVEVCEQYRLNPYQLTSAGSFLIVTEYGRTLTDALHSNQIQASIIGRLTSGNDKIIHNGEDVRYLDRPAPDEIYKILL